jgi:hypothetical protein
MNTQRNISVKLSVIAVALLGTLVLATCSPAEPVAKQQAVAEEQVVAEEQAAAEQQPVRVCADKDTGTQMTYEEAVAIAEAGRCTDQGPLKETHMCNSTTGTWWIDLDIDQPGCAPACVVNIVDETVEIVWRCTGVLPEATATDEAPAPPDAASAATPTATPDAIVNWPKYASRADGFAFRYPPTWTIELLTDRPAADGAPAARAVLLTQETLRLLIEFKRPDEAAAVGPGNLPAGTVEERAGVTLFERELPKHVLVDEGKDRMIFVGDRYPDLEVYIQLVDDVGEEEAAAAEISAAARAEFDQILASFTRTGTQTEQNAYAGWATYTSSEVAPGVVLTFRYRSDWTLTETQAGTETPTGPSTEMALLQRDAYVLRVQYKHTADETAMIAADIPDSLLMQAGTAWFVNRSVPRLVVVDEERLTHIFVSYTDDVVLVNIDLSQDPTIVAEDELDLTAGIRNEMDEILASFQLVTP